MDKTILELTNIGALQSGDVLPLAREGVIQDNCTTVGDINTFVEGQADDEPTEESTQLVKSGGVFAKIANAITLAIDTIEEWANNLFAKKDGYYSQLTAGSAENLVGQTVDSEAYLIRPTGGAGNEVANGIAYVEGMEGNSCVWNQMVDSDTTSVTLISGRKYYTKIDGTAAVVSGAGSAVSVTGGVDMVIDLTLLGIANLTEVSKVEEWIAQHVGTKPYYAYNAGTILSSQTLGIKTYGQNLLSPETRQAKLIPYTWVEDGVTYSNQYTIKNVPSGATAEYTPDNTGVAESVTITDNTFDISSYGSGILELSAATANTYICMKWNTEKDNDVVPYEDHTYDFDVRNVYGKVSGAGEYVQCFPNGMKSAGSVHDTLDTGKAVSRLNIVDLGTLNWTYNSSENYFWTQINNMSTAAYENPIVAICSAYKVVSAAVGRSSDKVVFNYNNDASRELILKDSALSSSDIVDGKIAKLNGVKLCYRTNPTITYTDLVYRDNGVDTPLGDFLLRMQVNNWSMEEQLMTPYDNGNPTSIPAAISTVYAIDAVEQLDTLQKTTYKEEDVHDNLQALVTCINTNCSTVLGGTFAVSDTATDKVFDFTFTPNVEPEVEPENEGE